MKRGRLSKHSGTAISRAAVAERILNLAVKGERNPARLLDGALSRSKTDAERDRLERALEEGLRGTFPASDAVSRAIGVGYCSDNRCKVVGRRLYHGLIEAQLPAEILQVIAQ